MIRRLIKSLFILLLIVGCLYGKDSTDVNLSNNVLSRENRLNISKGLNDSRVSFTCLSISYDFVQKKNDEVYFGAGIFPSMGTFSSGWKHYFKNNKASIFSIFALEYTKLFLVLATTKGLTQTFVIGYEYDLSNSKSIQFGLKIHKTYFDTELIIFENEQENFPEDKFNNQLKFIPAFFINFDVRTF